MEVREALIPSAGKEPFLLKLFNVHPPSGPRAFRLHKHLPFEIVLFKSGEGTYRTVDREYDIQSGDVFLFGSNEVHCITDIRGEMSLMNIHFEPRFIWANGNDLFDARFLKIFFHRSKRFEHRLDRNNPHTKVIQNLLLAMEEEFSGKPVEHRLMVKVQLLTILVHLIRHFGYVKEDEEDVYIYRNNFEMIERAMEYMDLHLTEPLTLKDLAQTANMSKTYFCAVFKKLNGITPWDYITARRIERAVEQLKIGTSCTMLELATHCGFNNTANFNRAFKMHTGKTPSEVKQGGSHPWSEADISRD
ncbi:MAG: helix-turn-helix protein [Paenibacillaceae bacterium]|jgi:AraC-like DNA-binding protein|nr:helix-turn-helix protein [Paenibacillaceae bacterium]